MNNYDKLLDFLESQEIKKSKEIDKKINDANSQEVAQAKNTSISLDIDKVIEESQSDLFEIPQSTKSSNHRGFDVVKFENLMRSKLIEEYKKLQSYERPYISVTELFLCMRSNYYNRLRYQVEVKDLFTFAYLKLIQEVGNTIHELVLSIYDFTETEKTIISEKHKVKGRIDAAKENFLFEIKTVETNKFSGKYNINDYNQGNVYTYILNSEYNYNISEIVLLYFFRDNLKKRPVCFNIPPDPKQAEFYISKASILLSHIQRKEVPDIIGATDNQCRYCLYKKYCEKDHSSISKPYMKEKNIENPLEKKKTVFII